MTHFATNSCIFPLNTILLCVLFSSLVATYLEKQQLLLLLTVFFIGFSSSKAKGTNGTSVLQKLLLVIPRG